MSEGLAILAIIVSVLLWVANVMVYRWHTRNTPKQPDSGEAFALSGPTRWFKIVGPGCYGLAFLHIIGYPFIYGWQGPSVISLAAGTLLGAAGIYLLIASLKALGANFAPCHRGRVPEVRVRSGPYAWCPHPIYLANVLQLAAAAVILPGALIYFVIVVLLWVYAFAIRDENRCLNSRLNDQPNK